MNRLLLVALVGLSGCPSAVGTQGPQGAEGPPGVAGAQGAKGDPGAPGPVGATGPAGAMGAQGAPGVAGPQGLQGPQGAVIVIDGGVVVGPPGSSVLVTPITPGGAICPRGGVRLTQLSDGGLSNVCNGADGAQGPAGASGPQGAAGPQGAPGASVAGTLLSVLSPQCPTGGALLTFSDGGTLAVCNGAVGAPGPVGLQGSVGAAGATGPQGPPGPAGATGSIGPAGAAGAQGASGAQGVPGPAGPSGPSGPAGPTGPAGPAGAVLFLDGGVVALASGPSGPVHVGYTGFTSNGNLGGRTAANARCAAQFGGSHLCNENEFRLARSGIALGAAAAWLDFSSGSDPAGSAPCGSWTSSNPGFSFLVIQPSGYSSASAAGISCASVLPLACCTVASPKLRGYTAALTTGNMGGRTAANGRCVAEFPGSHVCNENEFRLARSSQPLSAAAAWLDFSSGNDPAGSSPCGSWTSANPGFSFLVALPSGFSSASAAGVNCASSLPIACCE